MPLIQLVESDGSYQRLKTGWQIQCQQAGEEFEDFARGTFLVLDELAAKPEKRAGIFAVQRGEALPEIVCQANCTPLPGHPEPVLRVRMVTMSPALDFGTGDDSVNQYIDTLIELFYGVIELSQSVDRPEMNAKEIKFHLRSPEDYAFFRGAVGHLAGAARFERVEMKGAWLYITREN